MEGAKRGDFANSGFTERTVSKSGKRYLEDKSRRFTEANRENIERILGPLNKDIQEFRKKVEESYSKETVERTVLERKIAELVQLNNRIREDAVNLTNALKGNTKTQGDWGEMILERILENSGIDKRKGVFYSGNVER